MSDITYSRLKYICTSFASNISTGLLTEDATNESKYKVFGASGLIGYYNVYFSKNEYLGIIKDGAGVGRINKYPAKTSVLGTMAYVIPNSNTDIDWLKYCIQSLYLAESLDKTTIPHIYFSEYGNRRVATFELEKQKQISSFLNKKTSCIDSLIETIDKQIKLLQEYRKSIIYSAVAKGLDTSKSFKGNDAIWIGKIPSHWAVKKAKYFFETRNTKGNNQNLELLSPTQKFGVIPQSKYEELTSMVTVKINENTNLMSFKTIHKGDFCISLRSFEGGFEYCEYEGVVSPAYTVFYPTIEVERRYYKYLFKIQPFIREMNSYSLSLRDGKPISFDDFGNTYIPLPPLDEQKNIADYLDKKCNDIDLTIKNKELELIVLEKYKKSLIDEYVTGKKEVPNE